ncbi:hypothetical protein AB0C24_10050 [Amycolatopsis japonica]|uniref:hypothetical protein n=1 Tax=Amycolatopsis japonica TaxID=208439 RepID=UPI0033FC93C9
MRVPAGELPLIEEVERNGRLRNNASSDHDGHEGRLLAAGSLESRDERRPVRRAEKAVFCDERLEAVMQWREDRWLNPSDPNLEAVEQPGRAELELSTDSEGLSSVIFDGLPPETGSSFSRTEVL